MRRIKFLCLLTLASCFLEPNNSFSVTGSVVAEATGQPVPGAMVELVYQPPFSSWHDARVLGSATTGTSGEFEIVVSDEFTYNCGNLTLEASAEGYGDVIFHGVAGNDRADATKDYLDRCSDGETAAMPIRMVALTGP